MPPFKHILFPVDFSERCRSAQPFVASMAQRFDARLTLLYVVEIRAAAHQMGESERLIELDIAAMVRVGEKYLSGFLEFPELNKVFRVVEHGDPAARIVEFANTNQVDLIMMPTHGYGKFRRLLLGSVTAKVLNDASCSVWTAVHAMDHVTSGFAPCHSILCAVDLAPESVGLIHYAAALAEAWQARLCLVHAACIPDSFSSSPREVEYQQRLLEWTRERTTALQRRAGTAFELCLECGSVPAVVRAAALSHHCDLIIIGRGKEQREFGSLRTNAYGIICEAPCPVLRI